MSQFIPRDSLVIQDRYTHPMHVGLPGQGVYVIFDKHGKISYSLSGNNLKWFYERKPENYMTGPIWLPLSPEDYNRVKESLDHLVNNL